MNPELIINKIKKKTLAHYNTHSYNDVRLSVQVKVSEGKEVKYV
jgi:hypothetical protein